MVLRLEDMEHLPVGKCCAYLPDNFSRRCYNIFVNSGAGIGSGCVQLDTTCNQPRHNSDSNVPRIDRLRVLMHACSVWFRVTLFVETCRAY